MPDTPAVARQKFLDEVAKSAKDAWKTFTSDADMVALFDEAKAAFLASPGNHLP